MTPRSARRVPIVLELAPRGMSRATVPVPDPLNGWKSEKRNQRAKTTATRATTAAIRPRRLRGSPGVLEVRLGMVRGLTRAPGRGRTPAPAGGRRTGRARRAAARLPAADPARVLAPRSALGSRARRFAAPARAAAAAPASPVEARPSAPRTPPSPGLAALAAPGSGVGDGGP